MSTAKKLMITDEEISQALSLREMKKALSKRNDLVKMFSKKSLNQQHQDN